MYSGSTRSILYILYSSSTVPELTKRSLLENPNCVSYDFTLYCMKSRVPRVTPSTVVIVLFGFATFENKSFEIAELLS